MNSFDIVIYNKTNDINIIKLCSLFSCGNIIIDSFLKSSDSRDPSICITYLFVSKIENKIDKLIGFFSLSTDAILEKNDEYKTGKVFNGSAIRISMFAIDKKFQQIKTQTQDGIHTIASIMLLNCIEIIKNIVKNHVGAAYIVLNSTKEGKNLYQHTGKFEVIEEDYSTPIHEKDGIESISMLKPIFDVY